MIFGYRLTNKPPHIESEEVKELHALLKAEKKVRDRQALNAAEEAASLKLALAESQYQARDRASTRKIKNQRQGLVHLRAAERYFEAMQMAKGARVSELKALVDSRLEKASHLGVELKGTITKTIQGLS